MTKVTEGFGERIEQLKTGLGYRRLRDMAAEMRKLTGVRTNGDHLSNWKANPPSPQTLATISLLHPAPCLCLKWLREGGEMPRIQEYVPYTEVSEPEPIPEWLKDSAALVGYLAAFKEDVLKGLGEIRNRLSNLEGVTKHLQLHTKTLAKTLERRGQK